MDLRVHDARRGQRGLPLPERLDGQRDRRRTPASVRLHLRRRVLRRVTAVPAYDGEGLARKGLVFVSVNYRVGVLGFLAHPELSKESAQRVGQLRAARSDCGAPVGAGQHRGVRRRPERVHDRRAVGRWDVRARPHRITAGQAACSIGPSSRAADRASGAAGSAPHPDAGGCEADGRKFGGRARRPWRSASVVVAAADGAAPTAPAARSPSAPDFRRSWTATSHRPQCARSRFRESRTTFRFSPARTWVNWADWGLPGAGHAGLICEASTSAVRSARGRVPQAVSRGRRRRGCGCAGSKQPRPGARFDAPVGEGKERHGEDEGVPVPLGPHTARAGRGEASALSTLPRSRTS